MNGKQKNIMKEEEYMGLHGVDPPAKRQQQHQ